jgi:hypothetical protein
MNEFRHTPCDYGAAVRVSLQDGGWSNMLGYLRKQMCALCLHGVTVHEDDFIQDSGSEAVQVYM